MSSIRTVKDINIIKEILPSENALFGMDVEDFLDSLPEKSIFDLVVTSSPYWFILNDHED